VVVVFGLTPSPQTFIATIFHEHSSLHNISHQLRYRVSVAGLGKKAGAAASGTAGR
jgi:hypothetical protein